MPEKRIRYKHINSVTKDEIIAEIDCIIPDGIVKLHNTRLENLS